MQISFQMCFIYLRESGFPNLQTVGGGNRGLKNVGSLQRFLVSGCSGTITERTTCQLSHKAHIKNNPCEQDQNLLCRTVVKMIHISGSSPFFCLGPLIIGM